MNKYILMLLALAVTTAPALAQKGIGVLTVHGTRTQVQIVLCLVHPPGTSKDSGLDVEFMNTNNQGYLHLNDFHGDGSYSEKATADAPVFLFGTTMGSVGAGALSTSIGSTIEVKTAPKTNGHTGLANVPGGTFSWVCP